MTYENIVCPVCSEKFTKDSDVVVCPECGTPMHRECYKKLGHCVNEDKHAEGFAWKAPYDEQAEQRRREEAERTAAAAAAGAANGKEGPEDDNPFGSYGQYTAGRDGSFGPNMRVISKDEKIGNYTAAEYSEVIGKNAGKYIPKFFVMQKTGRKMSWNFAAFFFPCLWLSYRKMYKEAFLAFLLSMILPLCFMNSIYKYYMTTIQATSDYLMSAPATVENKQTTEESTENETRQPAVLTVNSWMELAVQLFVGFFGNYMYRKKCDKVLSDSASRAGPDKVIYRAKKGGTSAWSVVAAMLIMYAVFMAAVGIVMKYDTDLATIIWRLFNR